MPTTAKITGASPVKDNSGNVISGLKSIVDSPISPEDLISTQALAAAGAVDITAQYVTLDSTGGGFAITLAAPNKPGQVLVIEKITAATAVTMALTNCQGGTAATSASFGAVGATLTLVSGAKKWNITAQGGAVTLS
jgi:hypothetical protein